MTGKEKNLWSSSREAIKTRKRTFIPTMMRLTPRAKKLLELAAVEQRRSQASVLEQLIVDHLYRYAAIQERLNMMLAKEKEDERQEAGSTGTDPVA